MQVPNGDWRLQRLERSESEIFRRLGEIEQKLALIPGIQEDVQEVKADCHSIRAWVEGRDQKKEELTRGQRIAVIGGIFLLASSMVAAITSLINAGAI
jgi:hypothetical protein